MDYKSELVSVLPKSITLKEAINVVLNADPGLKERYLQQQWQHLQIGSKVKNPITVAQIIELYKWHLMRQVQIKHLEIDQNLKIERDRIF